MPRSAIAETAASLNAAKPYTVSVAQVSAKKGQPATAQVIFKPGPGYHVNRDYPTTLKLKPAAGVTPVKANLSRQDAKLTEQEGRFEVILTSSEAGKKSVAGELRFAVCTDTTCDPQTSAVSIELDVK